MKTRDMDGDRFFDGGQKQNKIYAIVWYLQLIFDCFKNFSTHKIVKDNVIRHILGINHI